MKLYRIVKTKYAATAWSGTGAATAGGRWNPVGIKAVYVAGSISLAQLEMLVHVQNTDLLKAYSCFEIDVPEALIAKLQSSALPDNWQEDPAPDETQEIGEQWLEGTLTAALLVPSTLVPQEYNAVLNPNYPDYDNLVSTASEVPFSFDPRLAR